MNVRREEEYKEGKLIKEREEGDEKRRRLIPTPLLPTHRLSLQSNLGCA